MTELEKVAGRCMKLDSSSLRQTSQLRAFLEKWARKVAGRRANVTVLQLSCRDKLQAILLPAKTTGQKSQKPQLLLRKIKSLLAQSSPL